MYCDWPQLGRCCLCMPLRQGVLTFGYISVLFSAFMIGVYSFAIHHGLSVDTVVSVRSAIVPEEACIAAYCAELLFDLALIYGAHKKSAWHVRAYYYFAVTTAVALAALQLIDIFLAERFNFGVVIEMLVLSFAGFCLQVYLIILVRSLLKKLETSGTHMYDNQLSQILSGEAKLGNGGGVYNNTTTAPAPAEV